jgi:hypothetical protein
MSCQPVICDRLVKKHSKSPEISQSNEPDQRAVKC